MEYKSDHDAIKQRYKDSNHQFESRAELASEVNYKIVESPPDPRRSKKSSPERREPSHGDIQEQDDIQGRLAAARRRATAKKVRSDDEVLQKAEYFSKVNDTKVEIVKEEQEKRNVIDRNIQLKVGKQEKLPTQRDDTEDKAAHEKQKIEIGQPEHSNASKGIGFIPPASTSSTVSALKHRGLMRRFPSTSNANDVQNVRRRHLDERSPEVHFIGEIVGGLGFGRGSAISCLWKIEWGVSWKILEGKSEGQTQYSSSPLDEPLSVWNHPVDVHMACSAIEGWPRITMEVWKLDDYGRTSLEGYGFTHLPSNPGSYDLEISCWRCKGSSMKEELQHFFLGESSRLESDAAVFNRAWEDRRRLITVPTGKVHINVAVIQRHFSNLGTE